MFLKTLPFLIAGLILWYAVLIGMDIYKSKAKENENKGEEDEIDISEDASQFKPVSINKNGDTSSPKEAEMPEEQYQENETSLLDFDTETLVNNLGAIDEEILREKNLLPDGAYRPVISDGIDSEDFCRHISQASESSPSILSDVIHMWEKTA